MKPSPRPSLFDQKNNPDIKIVEGPMGNRAAVNIKTGDYEFETTGKVPHSDLSLKSADGNPHNTQLMLHIYDDVIQRAENGQKDAKKHHNDSKRKGPGNK